MAVNFIPTHKPDKGKILNLEKHLLEKNYNFLQVKTANGVLTCKGYCQPSDYSPIYYYKVKFDPNKYPKVYVTNPIIEYHDDIHMYKDDKSLCLHYPKDFSWTSNSRLYNTIIPWTHEWFLFYELYQIEGKWLHPFVNHKVI